MHGQTTLNLLLFLCSSGYTMAPWCSLHVSLYIACLDCILLNSFRTNHPCSSQIAPFIPTIKCRIRLLSPSLLLKDCGVSKAGSFALVGERMGFGPKEWLLPVIIHRSSSWAQMVTCCPGRTGYFPFHYRSHRSHELLFPKCSNDRSQLEFTPPFRRSIASSKANSLQNAF